MKKAVIWILIIVIVVGLLFWTGNKNTHQPPAGVPIKIGIVTDLTGPAAYWGESTRAGADILQKELIAGGKNVSFVFEDYQLDAAKAASAAQKLLNLDRVQAVYSEFNPGVIATASVLKNKQIPLIYVAALTSPLKDNPLFYKTYLDYQEGCKQISQKFKSEGVTKIGFLKMNLEPAQLCEVGIKEVYAGGLVSEGYNIGDTDFRTQLLKLKNAGVQAVINMAFEGDTVNTLKVMRDFKYNLRYGTVDDSITPSVLHDYAPQLKDAWTFGFNQPSKDFEAKLEGYKLSSPYGAALAYTHLRQLVNTLSVCNDNVDCIGKNLSQSLADSTIAFRGYKNRIADLEIMIKKY